MIVSTGLGKNWQRHFFYRKEVWKTTWKFKLAALVLMFLALAAAKGFLSERLAQNLMCVETTSPSDALLLENFDPDYLVFERAESLRRAGVASRVFVPLIGVRQGEVTDSYQLEFAKAMARVARLPDVEPIAVPNRSEPISLNAAKQIRDYLLQEKVRSVVVVAPGFRSRRSEMIYSTVFTPSGIRVGCAVTMGETTPENWTNTWHGIQGVAEQFAKLQYYRFYLLVRSH
jgi:hypothetical protein